MDSREDSVVVLFFVFKRYTLFQSIFFFFCFSVNLIPPNITNVEAPSSTTDMMSVTCEVYDLEYWGSERLNYTFYWKKIIDHDNTTVVLSDYTLAGSIGPLSISDVLSSSDVTKQWSVSGLEPFTSYGFVVTTVNGIGEGSHSEEVRGRTGEGGIYIYIITRNVIVNNRVRTFRGGLIQEGNINYCYIILFKFDTIITIITSIQKM